MAEEKTKLQIEREELELESLRDEMAKKRAIKEMRREALKEQEKAFKDKVARDAADQARCNHKKGGRDYAALQHRGDGENHSIVAWQHPLRYMIYLCTHCLFLWEPGVSEKFLKDGKTKNPTGLSHAQAAQLPTDNSPAGSVIFGPRE